jgi:hypothetical protein
MKGAVNAGEAVSARDEEGDERKEPSSYATQDAGIGDSGSERTDHDAERR